MSRNLCDKPYQKNNQHQVFKVGNMKLLLNRQAINSNKKLDSEFLKLFHVRELSEISYGSL